MRKLACIPILALFFVGAAHAQAYKWVDEDGIVHYSDRPHEGAEIIQLPSHHRSGTVAARPAPARTSQPAEEESAEQDTGYEHLSVASPAPEETLWNLEGTLSVSLDLQPSLRPGHRVRVYFDGQPQMVAGTSFQIDEVFRGTHNIQAEVLDRTGRVMIRSEPARFYVQQTSVLNPTRGPRPTPR